MTLARPNIGITVLGAGLLTLAAVEAGLLVAPGSARHSQSQSLELTPAIAPFGSLEPSQADIPKIPAREGGVISITSDSTTLGVAIYRLWGSGRIEASILGEGNIWTDWVPVAPGLSGDALKPKKKPVP